MFRRSKLIVALLFAVNILCKAQVCTLNQLPANLQNGLVAWYPFCGNALDATGNGNNGTNFGAAPTSDRFGNSNAAYYFSSSGCGTHIQATINTNSIQTGLTISLWVLRVGNGCLGPRILEINNVINGPGSAQWGWDNSNSTYFGSQTSNSTSPYSSFNPVTNNVWTLLTYTNDGSQACFYQDGVLLRSIASSGNPILGQSAAFGRMNHPAFDAFNGKLDDIMIYNRALSACEVSQLFNSSSSSFPPLQQIDFNPFPDTTSICGSAITLDAGAGFTSYFWSDGSVTQSIAPTTSGIYKVTVTNDGCTATDSSYVSIVKADILQGDTVICKGQSIFLPADSSNNICSYKGLPLNLQSGLVAFYPFCGNALDAGSNNLNGTTSNLSFGVDRFGKVNSSGVFGANGSPSFLSIPSNPLLQPLTYTLSAWFNTSVIQAGALGSGLDQVIAGYTPVDWSTGPAYKMFLYVTDNSSIMSRQWTPGTSWQDIVTATGFVSTGNWVHAVTTFDHTTGIQKLYLNGVLYGTRNSILQYNGQVALMIGATYESSGGLITGKFIGKIDDVGFWNRALSDAEIIQLYSYNGSQSLTYQWSTGATSKSITVTPTQTTTYYVTVSDGITSCTDSVKVTVAPLDTSVQNLDPLQLCVSGGFSSRLQAASGMSSYQWLKDGVQISGATNRLFTATQTGNYRVVVRNSLGCQDTSGVYTITFFPPPTGLFQTPALTDICEGGSITLTASGAVSYQWFRNGIIIPGAIAANYNAFLPGVYTVNFVSAQGCIAPSGKNITLGLLAKPEASFTYDSYCVGVLSNFSSTSTISNSGLVDLKWFFADGTSQSGNSVVHNFPRAGAYPVKLVVTPLNCPLNADTVIATISVQQAAAGIRYAPLNAVLNKTVTINARSIGTNWLWLPASNLSDPRSRSPQLTPKQEQQYLVRISNSAGCVTTDSLLVRIFDERNIYVAGGFTPNNDGKNDRLYPIPVGIAEFRYLRIYNRWGNLVFETNSTDPLRGWDGTYKGKAQPSDTFTWIAEGVDVDGNIVKRTGNSILIR